MTLKSSQEQPQEEETLRLLGLQSQDPCSKNLSAQYGSRSPRVVSERLTGESKL